MRRSTTLLLAGMLAFSACGSDDAADEAPTTTATETASTTTASESTTTEAAPTTAAATTTTEASPERGDTWFTVTGNEEVDVPEVQPGRALFLFEDFSGTWLLSLSTPEYEDVTFRFPDGFSPEIGEYPVASTTDEGIIATYSGPGASTSEFYDELQSGTFEITETGDVIAGSFSYEASRDDTGAETVMVEGGFRVERGEAFPTG
jgi:hypothetical protein